MEGSTPVVAAQAVPSDTNVNVTEAPVASEKYKLVVDGEETEVDLEELKSGYSKNAAATKRFQDAAKLQKQAAEIMQKFENLDVQEYLKSKNIDPIEYFQKQLEAYVEDSQLTPEQKAQRAEKAELEQLRAAKKAQMEAQERMEREAAVTQINQELDTEIAEALKEAGIKSPKPRHVARIAEHLLASLASEEGKRVSAKDAYSKVRDDYLQDMAEYLEDLEPEALLSTLPKSVVAKLRKHDIETVKKGSLPSTKAGAAPTEVKEEKKPKFRSMESFFDEIQPGNRLEI